MIGRKIHLLVHPDVVIDIWLFVDTSRRHGKQSKRDHHLLFDSGFLGFPVSNTINKSLQRILGTLLARHLMKITFEGDTVAAVHNRSYEIRADDLLVQLFATPT